MTTFQDIFKSSFLENVNSVSLLDMLLALALAFGLGMFIFLVYKKTFSGVMYSSSFGVTLIALTMITTIQEPCSREQILNAAEELRQALAEAEDMYLDGTEAEQQIN